MSRNQGFIPDRRPTDTARPEHAEIRTALSDATAAGLDRLGDGDPHTLHALLTGAVAALHLLYTPWARVVVGVPAPDGDGVVPLSLEISPDSTLREVAALVAEGSPSGAHPGRAHPGGAHPSMAHPSVLVRLEGLHDDRFPAVPLVFSFARGPGLRLTVRYERGRYDLSSVDRIVWHLRLLLGTLAAGPRVPLRAVELRTAEDDRWLAAHTAEPVRLPLAETVPAVFDAEAAAHPGAVAVIAGPTRLTYAELRRAADRMAGALRELGVDRDAVVGVRAEPSIPALVAALAVLKAGGAFLPLDPRWSAGRVAEILADGGAAFVTDGTAATVVDGGAAIPVDGGDPGAAPRLVRVSARDLACVRYAPDGPLRGVAIEHRSLVERIAWMQRAYPLRVGDTVLTRSPLSLWWMRGGATACLLPPGQAADPATVGAAGVTTLHTTPGELSAFLDRLEEIRAVPGLSRLRRVFCGGGVLSPGLVRRFHRLLSSASLRPRLVNLYGQAETGSIAAHFACDDPAPDRVLIGKAVDGVRLYVVDDRMRIRPVGVPGELCVAGEGLARNLPPCPPFAGETRVPPFAPETHVPPFAPESRVFATGDLVRWLPDGSVEHLGRAEDRKALGKPDIRVLQRSCG